MDWFKIWPSACLNVINRIPDGLLRGAFSLLLMHCLNGNGLPDDDDEIAYLTGLPLETVTALRPHLKRLATPKDGKLMICIAEEIIGERQEFAAKKAKAGEAGGKQKQANKEHIQQVLAKPSSASEKSAATSNGKLCLPPASQYKQTNKHEYTHENTAAEGVEVDVIAERQQQPAATDLMTALLCQLHGIRDESGWQINEQYSGLAMQLVSVGATIEQVKAFWNYRTVKPQLNKFVTDFASWRASQKVTVAPVAYKPEPWQVGVERE